MKYTVKHGLITCLGFEMLAMLLPWFGVSALVNISGIQIGCGLGMVLGGTVDMIRIGTAALSGYLPILPALSGGQLFVVIVVCILALAPFILTIVSLFISIFCTSKKTTIAILVMQIFNAILAMAYLIFLIYVANTINDVAIYNVEAGPYVYLAGSVAAVIVSVLILKRYLAKEAVAVKGDPSKSGVLCLSGEYLGVSIPLEGNDTVTIGRDASCCNLVLSGGKISRKHCEIRYETERGNYRVVDFSTNGTFVKGGSRLEKERSTELAAGTILCLGDEQNTFRLQ